MQLSIWEAEELLLWERMREIEGELFLLSARSVELDFEDGHQFERLHEERKDADLDLPILKKTSETRTLPVGRILWLIWAEGVRRLNDTE